MKQEEEQKFCKKIIFGNPANPDILLGLITNDSDSFITFRTANKERMISKTAIISIESTNEVFRGA